MKEPEIPFEERLAALRPSAPSRRLRDAITGSLADGPLPAREVALQARVRSLSRALWASWSVAALATFSAIVLWLSPSLTIGTEPSGPTVEAGEPQDLPEPESGDPQQLRMQPVGSAGYLLGATDEGIVRLDDGQYARRVRYAFVDTVQLAAPDETAAMAVAYPWEEIRFIPLHAH